MTRLLSIVMLASLLGGFAAAEAVGPQPAGSPPVALSPASDDSGEAMAAMGCNACAATGACIDSGPARSAGLGTCRLPCRQPLSHLSDPACAPETAPPKRSSS